MKSVGVLPRLVALVGVTVALAAAHAGCSTSPSFVSDGQGGGGGAKSGADCKTPDDCPGDENECAHRACTAGKCGVDYAPDGFLVGAQTMGDCQKAVCDGQGAVKSVPDDGDEPSDGNDCTVDLCSGGQPTHPPAMQGTPCGATSKLTCDGKGSCAGCTADADCGTNTPCTTYTCDAATTVCKIVYVAAGTGDPGNQQAGDCKKNVCNGSGGTATQNDDTDVPDDGNACTDDHCSMGTPSHSPSPAGTTCGGSFECDGNGSCAGCTKDADCGQNNACATFTCTGGSCQSTFVPSGQGDPGGQVTGDCKKNVCNGSGSSTSIADDTDKPVDGNPCTNDVCSNGVPSNPPLASGTSCGGSLLCDGAGNCKGCLSNADCGAGTACTTNVCQAGMCVTQNVGAGTSCGVNKACDGGGNCVCSDPGACNGKCGSFTDACGHAVSCGGCSAPQTCGGGGTPNVCGCTPVACNGKCGSVPNGCGGTMDCGGCNAPQTCGGGGTPNVCGCTPNPNPCPDNQCAGTASDGCGGQVACSTSCSLAGYCACAGGSCVGSYCACKPPPCL